MTKHPSSSHGTKERKRDSCAPGVCPTHEVEFLLDLSSIQLEESNVSWNNTRPNISSSLLQLCNILRMYILMNSLRPSSFTCLYFSIALSHVLTTLYSSTCPPTLTPIDFLWGQSIVCPISSSFPIYIPFCKVHSLYLAPLPPLSPGNTTLT